VIYSRRPGARFNRGRIPTGPPADGTPLGAGTWANGIYFDFTDAAYEGYGQGDVVTTLTPRIGAGVLTAEGNPSVDIVPTNMGGRRTLLFASADLDALAAHWLATLSNGEDKTFSVLARVRIIENGSRCIAGFGSSASLTQNFCEVFTSSTVGTYNARRDSAGTTVNSGSYGNLLLGTDRTIGMVFDGITATAYRDGVAFGSPATIDVGTIPTDRFRFGATGRSSPTLHSGLAMQNLAITNRALTAGEVLTVHNAWLANDLPPIVGTQFAEVGDSLTKGPASGGYRNPLAAWITANCAPNHLTAVGDQVYGTFTNPRHMGYPSLECAQIITKYVAQVGTGKAYSPKLSIIWMGTNDVNNVPGDVSAAVASYTTQLTNAHNAAVSSDAAARLMVTTLTDYLGITSDIVAFNTAIAGPGGVWDVFDAAHPSNTLKRLDLYTKLGAAGTSGLWQPDGVHLTDAGHQQVCDEITTKHGAYLISIAT